MILLKSRFLHLSVAVPLIVPAQQAAIEQILGMSGDWLRYAANCWVVYTAQLPMTLVEQIQTIRGMDQASFLVAELGAYAGRLDQKAWDWMNQVRFESRMA